MTKRKYYRKKKARVPKETKTYVKRTQLKGMEPKQKACVLSTTFGSVGDTWVEWDATEITQEVAVTNRIGNEITITSLEFYGILRPADTYNDFRIVVALWDGRNQVPCATNSVTLGLALTKAMPSSATVGLITKYKDMLIGLCTTDKNQRVVKFSKTWKTGLRIKYSTSANTTAQRRLIVSMLSDSGAVGHPGFTSGWIQVGYRDS